jgi:hypothetical protein
MNELHLNTIAEGTYTLACHNKNCIHSKEILMRKNNRTTDTSLHPGREKFRRPGPLYREIKCQIAFIEMVPKLSQTNQMLMER